MDLSCLSFVFLYCNQAGLNSLKFIHISSDKKNAYKQTNQKPHAYNLQRIKQKCLQQTNISLIMYMSHEENTENKASYFMRFIASRTRQCLTQLEQFPGSFCSRNALVCSNFHKLPSIFITFIHHFNNLAFHTLII